LWLQGRVGSSGASGVQEEFVIIRISRKLLSAKSRVRKKNDSRIGGSALYSNLVGVARDENVGIHASELHGEGLLISPGNNLKQTNERRTTVVRKKVLRDFRFLGLVVWGVPGVRE
jgi:hypothetical protein